MMSKAERAEFDAIRHENARLQKTITRLESAIEKEQDRIVSLEILFGNHEESVGKLLKTLRQTAVEILTGTPPEDQTR